LRRQILVIATLEIDDLALPYFKNTISQRRNEFPVVRNKYQGAFVFFQSDVE
jgi:hypothetical protein